MELGTSANANQKGSFELYPEDKKRNLTLRAMQSLKSFLMIISDRITFASFLLPYSHTSLSRDYIFRPTRPSVAWYNNNNNGNNSQCILC